MNEYSRKPSLDLMLSIITLGFYDIYLMYKIISDTAELKYQNDDADKLLKTKKIAALLAIVSLAISIAFIVIWFNGVGRSNKFFVYEPIVGVATIGVISSIWHVTSLTRIYKIKPFKARPVLIIISAICSILGLKIVGAMICDSKINKIRSAQVA